MARGQLRLLLRGSSLPASLAPTANRPWIADLAAVPNNIKLMSALAAPACAILLYMDQNITTRLVNNSAGLKKPRAYHLDMFWLSSSPPSPPCAASPGSAPPPCTPSPTSSPSPTPPRTPLGQEKVTNVTETRWTPLVLNLLIGLSIVCLKPILVQIPMCVLSGLFFYLGLAAMRGNEFLERVSMTLITDPNRCPRLTPLSPVA